MISNVPTKIEITNFPSANLTDWLSILSIVVSLVSLCIVLFDYLKKYKLEKLNLKITASDTISNPEEEVLFIFTVMSNESSLPISISDMHLSLLEGPIHDTALKFKGGSASFENYDIRGRNLGLNDPVVRRSKLDNLPIPLTLGPYESIGGYIAFNCGINSSLVIPHKKDLTLEITTTRGTLYRLIQPTKPWINKTINAVVDSENEKTTNTSFLVNPFFNIINGRTTKIISPTINRISCKILTNIFFTSPALRAFFIYQTSYSWT